MKEIIISIVVPIYNAEKFIDRMISSIENQLTEEIELLLVDDGSTDNSGKICDEYAGKNPCIHVIHQKNGGSSVARNAGIRAARGEYVSFVDVDDYVEAETYSTIMTVIQKYHPDCIDFGWKYISRTGGTSCSENMVPKAELLGQDFINDKIVPTLLNLMSKEEGYFVYDFVWNKLYRRDKIAANGILFSEGRRTWEDRLFVLSYLYYCENYYSMAECFYNYVDVPNSKSQKFNIDRLRIIVENYRKYKALYAERYDFDTEYANSYWASAIDNMVMASLKQSEQREMILDAVRTVLREEEVKMWFQKRQAKGKIEQKTGALIVAGDVDQAIECYLKKIKDDRREAALNSFKCRIKQGVKKIIRLVKRHG